MNREGQAPLTRPTALTAIKRDGAQKDGEMGEGLEVDESAMGHTGRMAHRSTKSRPREQHTLGCHTEFMEIDRAMPNPDCSARNRLRSNETRAATHVAIRRDRRLEWKRAHRLSEVVDEAVVVAAVAVKTKLEAAQLSHRPVPRWTGRVSANWPGSKPAIAATAQPWPLSRRRARRRCHRRSLHRHHRRRLHHYPINVRRCLYRRHRPNRPRRLSVLMSHQVDV